MTIEIASWDGRVLFSLETGSLTVALEAAVKSDADLGGADLRGANLGGADLVGANLRDANLRGARLDTGETLDEYRREVVPALIAAGGRPVSEAAWSCHSWENCPMAEAFGVHRVDDVPRLHRPRVEQFIRLFDAGVPVRP